MKQRKVLIVTHATLVPPDDISGLTKDQMTEWKTEYDVIHTLRLVGHEVRVLGVLDSLTELRAAIIDWKPDIVFNLLEEFNGSVLYDQYIVAFLELMQQPYTGCNPRGLLLSRDKPLMKQLLTYHRIPTPQFVLLRNGLKVQPPRRMKYPLFVKSATEDASLGIAQTSVVEDVAHLKERVAFIHDQVGTDALVEEYIAGREVYVGVLGNERLTRLPVRELHFGTMPGNHATIATRKVKWDRKYQEKYGIDWRMATDLPSAVEETLDRLSRRIYRALGLSGYARMDFRIRDNGEVFVLEANANPNIGEIEDFAQSALKADIGYRDLLNRIIALGVAYKAEWRAGYS
ncbi:MAG: D-alanine--D-alanine ligase [Gammaproteobacteria bacterium]|nr:D-alanine--D-alanine ligase [Gammaproteobacteria bacterium]